MRLFQNFSLYPDYIVRLNALSATSQTFRGRQQAFLADRYSACHLLEPTHLGAPEAFITCGDDRVLQRRWAVEQGLRSASNLTDILLAQIEAHKTEVFYNHDPLRFSSDFLKKLPGCVRKSLAWRASPSPQADFSRYDLVLGNFRGILSSYARRGWKTACFFPSHDPVLDGYARKSDRRIDILFVGSYSRHHLQRSNILMAVAAMRNRYRVVFHLSSSRLTRLAESPLGLLPPLRRHRRPRELRSFSEGPVFGQSLYEKLSDAKVVLNGSGEIAGSERGNMRCFEAMGAGAAMISDQGIYPPGMLAGLTHVEYAGIDDVRSVIEKTLGDPEGLARIAARGHLVVSENYSKTEQWKVFQELASD